MCLIQHCQLLFFFSLPSSSSCFVSLFISYPLISRFNPLVVRADPDLNSMLHCCHHYIYTQRWWWRRRLYLPFSDEMSLSPTAFSFFLFLFCFSFFFAFTLSTVIYFILIFVPGLLAMVRWLPLPIYLFPTCVLVYQ